MVEVDLVQRNAAIVRAVIDVDDFQLFDQQLDGRQDAVAVQAVRIQLVRPEVGRGDDGDAVAEHRVQQPVQDHRVGHVGDVELVEADQPEALGDALAKFFQWVGNALQVLQLAVHLAHELVEVQARLAGERHGLEEAVHQEALAAADAAVHIDAARQRRAHEQLGHGVGAPCLVVGPFVLAALQGHHGAQLRRVGLVAALGQDFLVELGDGRH